MQYASLPFALVELKTLDTSGEIAEVAVFHVTAEPDVSCVFHTLVRPGTRIPESFTRITGLYSAAFDDKPTLETILPTLAEVLAGHRIVVFHRNTWKALYRQAKQLGFMAFPDQVLTLDNLALQLNHPPRNCEEWADEFGWVNPAPRRSHGDGQVLARLLQRLVAEGDDAVVEAWLSMQFPGLQKNRPEVFAFDPAKLSTYPTNPGVYFMKDAAGRLLYIGKAKNLRRRLKSYFQQTHRHARKVLELLRLIDTIEIRKTGSELEALLLEAELIKSLQPPFNKLIKDFERMVFLKVSLADTFPKLSAVYEMDEETAVYFGPFSRKSSLEQSLETLNRTFRLRSCTDVTFAKHRQSPCIQYQLGQCSGPCAGLISQESYQAQVEDFVQYLTHGSSATVEACYTRRDLLAETLAFEEAAALQAQLEQLDWIRYQAFRSLKAIHETHAVIVLPGTETGIYRILTVFQGQPLSWQTWHVGHRFSEAQDQVRALYRRLKTAPPAVLLPKEKFEEARILAAWLPRHNPAEALVLDASSLSEKALLSRLEKYLQLLQPVHQP